MGEKEKSRIYDGISLENSQLDVNLHFCIMHAIRLIMCNVLHSSSANS